MKAEMIDKLEDLRDLVQAGELREAYDLLLHDIKPKLTGLMTNEDEVPWGDGTFKKPWITNATLQ